MSQQEFGPGASQDPFLGLVNSQDFIAGLQGQIQGQISGSTGSQYLVPTQDAAPTENPVLNLLNPSNLLPDAPALQLGVQALALPATGLAAARAGAALGSLNVLAQPFGVDAASLMGPAAQPAAKPAHPSVLKPEHRNSKATRRGPMDEMRQVGFVNICLIQMR